MARAEGLACGDLGARTPIGASGILIFCPNKNVIKSYSLETAGWSGLVPSFQLVRAKCVRPAEQNLGRPLFWSERSACDQRSNLGRSLFLVLIFLSIFLLLPPLFKFCYGLLSNTSIRIPINKKF